MMINTELKQAIKVALSVVLAICLAMHFQWEKPYWAGISAAVVALDETFAHSIQKGRHRLVGAFLGVFYALFLIATFSQQRELFLLFYTFLLALSLYGAKQSRFGYIFVQAFTVCTIICCMGGFESNFTFHFMVLRIQETFLGIFSFIGVYKIFWPVKTQDIVKQKFDVLLDEVRELVDLIMTDKDKAQSSLEEQCSQLFSKTKDLHQLIKLPANGSYKLEHYRKDLMTRIDEVNWLIVKLQNQALTASQLESARRHLSFADISQPNATLLPSDLPYTKLATTALNAAQLGKHQALKTTLQGVLIFVLSILLWIYLPVPGGFVFPMMAGIIAINIPILPEKVIKQALKGSLFLGGFYFGQFVFFMPAFTELWQLAACYFINIIAIFLVFNTPGTAVYRVLGINLMLVLTSGALNLTPSFNVNMPLTMIVNLVLVLAIAKFVSLITHPKY